MHHQHSTLWRLCAFPFYHRFHPLKPLRLGGCRPLAGNRLPPPLQPSTKRLVIHSGPSRKTLPGHPALIVLRQQRLPSLRTHPYPPTSIHGQHFTRLCRTCRICHTRRSMTLLHSLARGATRDAYACSSFIASERDAGKWGEEWGLMFQASTAISHSIRGFPVWDGFEIENVCGNGLIARGFARSLNPGPLYMPHSGS